MAGAGVCRHPLPVEQRIIGVGAEHPEDHFSGDQLSRRQHLDDLSENIVTGETIVVLVLATMHAWLYNESCR